MTVSGYEALRSDAALIRLTGRGQIRVTGDDRARLLHAMSTNDVKNLAPDRGLYSFFLNAQGRILADAYIWNLGESLLLDTEPELRQKLYEHLDKYLIADDAYLQDVTDEWDVFSLEGPRSLEWAARLELPVPGQNFAVSHLENGFIAWAATTGLMGFRIFHPPGHTNAWLDRMKTALPFASAEEALTVRIENSIPRYGEEITERYLVQETGVLQAVHPNKGCYLGQEIVERVKSRAQVHRHLRKLRIAGNAVPALGTKLQMAGKDVAEIVSATYSPASNAVVAFAYVRTEALTDGARMTVAGSSQPAHLA